MNADRTELGADGTVRKAHYGESRQPIDDIFAAGWGPAFCAGNVLKYLRRTKEPEHSLESARDDLTLNVLDRLAAGEVLLRLEGLLLTREERERLDP